MFWLPTWIIDRFFFEILATLFIKKDRWFYTIVFSIVSQHCELLVPCVLRFYFCSRKEVMGEWFGIWTFDRWAPKKYQKTQFWPLELTCPCNLHSGINPLLSLRARRFVTKNWGCVLIASSNHVMQYPKTIHTILFYSTKILATWFPTINTTPSQQQFNCILQTNIDYIVVFLPFLTTNYRIINYTWNLNFNIWIFNSKIFSR